MRFGLALAAGLLGSLLSSLMSQTPLGGKVEWIAWSGYVSGAMFGPLGVLASFFAQLFSADSLLLLSYNAKQGLAYASIALTAWLFHRFLPGLGRGPRDMRSYIGFVISVICSGAVLAAVGSALTFPDAFGLAFSFWFSSAVTSLLIGVPLLLLEADRLLDRWIALPRDPVISMPVSGRRLSEGHRGIRPAPALMALVGLPAAMIMAAIAHFKPGFAQWVFLFYLLPIVWSAIHYGLRGGVLTASACGVLLLTGAGVMEFLSPSDAAATHATISFAVPILLSVVGAAAGAFQTERERMVAELEMAERRLHRASQLEALGLLAGGVAHDFNNLLTVIGGNAAMARVQLPEDNPAHGITLDIENAVANASSLTRQLVGFSQQQDLSPELMNLNEVVSSQASLLKRLIGSRISVGTRLWEAPVTIEADPAQIGRVILNLALNARDAMPGRGALDIEVAISDLDEEGRQRMNVEDERSFARLTVSDNGEGMDSEVVRQIFEPFFTTKASEGTGLGLTTVHGIVRQSGGHVDVVSSPGEGTRFILYFPLADGA